ncbi:hypothetical protein KDL45_19020, partial [bacterium]|nr:hypothetical protein [bacterium]
MAAALFACTAGDDDDDAADDDTVVDDDDASDDDDSGDDDTSDDDYPLGECTNIADEVLPLPACSPYEEKAPWIETDSHYYAPGFYSGSVAQKPVTATVDLRLGGRFRLVNDDGELK